MKAVILAGGKGTRARPFTDYFPKAMIPIQNRPLIWHVIKHLSKFRFIDEIIILADYAGLGGQIRNYFEHANPKIKFVQDSSHGTGGDLVHLQKHVGNEFVLWFVDNLCPIDLGKMFKVYKQKKSLVCIATRRYRQEETGYAKVENGIITEFVEKPVIKQEMSECLGIYILDKKILQMIKSKKKKEVNLSFDLLEEISKKKMCSAFDIGKTPWIDVESPAKIERNQKLVNSIILRM
jgi:mannose-1-phosphate guanylyltransferase